MNQPKMLRVSKMFGITIDPEMSRNARLESENFLPTYFKQLSAFAEELTQYSSMEMEQIFATVQRGPTKNYTEQQIADDAVLFALWIGMCQPLSPQKGFFHSGKLLEYIQRHPAPLYKWSVYVTGTPCALTYVKLLKMCPGTAKSYMDFAIQHAYVNVNTTLDDSLVEFEDDNEISQSTTDVQRSSTPEENVA